MASKKKVTKKKAVKSSVVESKPVQKSDVLWAKIKDLPLNLFGLPDQTVENNSKRYQIDPDSVWLELKTSAVLSALEEALKTVSVGEYEMFDISTSDKYTVIKLIPKLKPQPFVGQRLA